MILNKSFLYIGTAIFIIAVFIFQNSRIDIPIDSVEVDRVEAIDIAKKYIKNGDIFQVVPSQRFETKYTGSVLKLYQALRKTNPSPFMYYFNFPRFKIVGSSPEILVRLRNKKITIRPIAGPRPRGTTKKLDNKYAFLDNSLNKILETDKQDINLSNIKRCASDLKTGFLLSKSRS